MKRLLGTFLIATSTMMTSQASTQVNGNALYGNHIPIATPHPIAIRSGQAHVSTPRIPKFKVLRSNPHRYSRIVIDDFDGEVDDEGLMSPYRRRDLNKIEHEDGISEKVRWRLFLARQLALMKHRELFG